MKIKTKDMTSAGQSILMSPGEMIRALRELKEWSQLGKERAIVLARALNVHSR